MYLSFMRCSLHFSGYSVVYIPMGFMLLSMSRGIAGVSVYVMYDSMGNRGYPVFPVQGLTVMTFSHAEMFALGHCNSKSVVITHKSYLNCYSNLLNSIICKDLILFRHHFDIILG